MVHLAPSTHLSLALARPILLWLYKQSLCFRATTCVDNTIMVHIISRSWRRLLYFCANWRCFFQPCVHYVYLICDDNYKQLQHVATLLTLLIILCVIVQLHERKWGLQPLQGSLLVSLRGIELYQVGTSLKISLWIKSIILFWIFRWICYLVLAVMLIVRRLGFGKELP